MASDKKTTTTDIDDIDESAAKAAQDEAENVENVEVEFGGQTYTISRAAVGSAQFRYLIQRSRDALAAELLLGNDGFTKFLTDQAEPDGFTPSVKLWEFLNAAGKELGTGNR